MVNKKYQPRVERLEDGTAKLWVPHNGGEIAFASPAVGSNTYRKNGSQILRNGLLVPTGDYIASLLHAAYCNPDLNVKDKPEFEDVMEKIRGGILNVFNQILWISKGAFSIQDLKAVGRSQPLDIEELEKILGVDGGIDLGRGIILSKDKRVGYAPKETILLGEQSSSDLARNGITLIVCKEEGAEKMGEVSSKFSHNPYVGGLDIQEGQSPEQRVSVVYSDFGRLGFFGSDRGGVDCNGGHAFGVFKGGRK